ncbi:hypothetical protein [Spirosoma harenae]
MMSYFPTILTVFATILLLYAILCFIAHYLDFGWKFISGSWLHEDWYLIKRIRSGIFHQLLIGLVLVVVMYGGLTQILAFIPSDWGRVDESGKMHPYRNSINSVLAVLLATITMYGFHVADTFFNESEKPTRKQS